MSETDEKLLESDHELIERERKCMSWSRFNLRDHICGPRMRLYTALKSLISITYAILLMTAIINFNVIHSQLNKLQMAKNSDLATTKGGGRQQYQIALWFQFLLCIIHFVACAVTIVTSFCGKTRKSIGRVVHVAWWLIFALTAIIPIISLILYFGFLPRAIQETFTQLSDAARSDYKSIIPLQEEFDCCSVEYIPDADDPDRIQRFEPKNSNFSCAMRDMYVVKRVPSPLDDSHVIFKSKEPQKVTCTAKILSHFPDKVRWVWILKASAIPHTAFGWIFVFDLMFILTVWFERGYYYDEDDEENEKEMEDKSANKAPHSNESNRPTDTNQPTDPKPINLSPTGNLIRPEQIFITDIATREKSTPKVIDHKTNSGKLQKRSLGVNISSAIDQPHLTQRENAAPERRSSLPSAHDLEQQLDEKLIEQDGMGLLFPGVKGKPRTLSNISERDTDVSASGSFSKSESATTSESD